MRHAQSHRLGYRDVLDFVRWMIVGTALMKRKTVPCFGKCV
jgi:hypothetical protein